MASPHVDFLANERAGTKLDVRAMSWFVYGGKEEAERMDRLAKFVAEDPVFKKDDVPHLSRASMMKHAIKKGVHAFKKSREMNLTDKEYGSVRLLVDDIMPTNLHYAMFIPTLEGQATDEQRREWLPKAEELGWVGCYAQTELGHGSNVQGLETTATYDATSDEFILNSPTVTSTKWWAGGLGKVATHAIVYARLITLGKDRGVHGFLVQIRSLINHESLPGVHAGDIGPKFGHGGYNTMDNGMLRLSNVRIPRGQMLMRHARVDRAGNYFPPAHGKLGYGTMVYVRAGIVVEAGYYLAKAVTIAVRYNAVRRQFKGSKGDKLEMKIIDYSAQQHRLFPLVASCYANFVIGRWIVRLYENSMKELKSGGFLSMAEMHAVSAGLKALTTSMAADGIEECRKLCGGHGYLVSSGLPELFACYVPACTYEGDNQVLLLQVARFLIKAWGSSASDRPPRGTAAYLGDGESLCARRCAAEQSSDWSNPAFQIEALSVRAAYLVSCCVADPDSSEPPAMSDVSVQMIKAAKAHCERIMAVEFSNEVEAHAAAVVTTPSSDIIEENVMMRYGGQQTRGITSEVVNGQEEFHKTGIDSNTTESINATTTSLRLLRDVYALSKIESSSGDLLEAGYLTRGQIKQVREQLMRLLKQMRHSAVAMVDAFNFTDHYLGSALGRYDGDVYTHLFETACRNPLNDQDVVDGYEEYLKPLIMKNQMRARL